MKKNNSIYKNVIKPILDIGLAVGILIITFPLIIIGAIAIKIDSKGPIFFTQTRIGKDCKKFKIYKLRTMKVDNTDKFGNKLRDRDRVTRAGKIIRKLSIDELPQLFNIVKGEMSFIGPRPLLVRYLPYYNNEEIRRHDVLPGITGLAQVKGRGFLSWEERFAYDLIYVEKLSFIFDFKLLIQTIKVVLKSEGTDTVRPEGLVDFDVHRGKGKGEE